MAKWQITKKGVPIKADHFDDGDLARPGDESFSREAAVAEAKKQGGDGVNYVGASEPPTEDA